MKNFGLIGYPLSHSFSKKFFSEKFNSECIDAKYTNYEISSINEFSKLFKNHTIDGLNVTIPYKEAVIPFLDDLDDISSSVGAVNTIVPLFKDGSHILKGFNTDVYGFHQSIRTLLKSHHQKALVLGTGGASKSIEYVLKKYGITVNFISRTKNSPTNFSWDELNNNMVKHHGIIVNTTPLGMFPNENLAFPFPYEYLTSNHLVIDLIYNPKETLFLKRSKLNGAQILNGEKMLINQALKSWEIWCQNDNKFHGI
ncbi:shikimate dehydrogenase [Flavobacteriales bacterium]|nr:shikimate dehydrogenase [Flavobacteriales bacterium]